MCQDTCNAWSCAGWEGWRRDSGDSGQSAFPGREQTRFIRVFLEEDLSLFIWRDVWLSWGQKVPLAVSFLEWGEDRNRNESPGVLLSARKQGDSESHQGTFVTCALARRAGNDLAPVLSDKVKNIFLHISPGKWCLLVRHGNWSGKISACCWVSLEIHPPCLCRGRFFTFCLFVLCFSHFVKVLFT